MHIVCLCQIPGFKKCTCPKMDARESARLMKKIRAFQKQEWNRGKTNVSLRLGLPE